MGEEDIVNTAPPDELWEEYCDARAEVARLELFRQLRMYRRIWGVLWPTAKAEAKKQLLLADRAVSAWVEEGRVTAACREKMLRTLKYVEYWYLGIYYWGPQRLPPGERP